MTDDASQKITERYNREAQDYQRLWAPVLRVAELRLLDEIADAKPQRVLDVGAGVGVLLPELRRRFPQAFIAGVDRSSGMIALAPAEFPTAVMDATQFAIASSSVDLVCMAFVLFHLRNPLDGLFEARRVLRPHGRIATLTWAKEMDSVAHQICRECLDAYGAPPADPHLQTRLDPLDNPEKVSALLQAAGFGQVRVWDGELSTTFDMDSLLQRFTRMGAPRSRFDGMTPVRQTNCLAAMRRKLFALSPEEFTARGKVVYAIARV